MTLFVLCLCHSWRSVYDTGCFLFLTLVALCLHHSVFSVFVTCCPLHISLVLCLRHSLSSAHVTRSLLWHWLFFRLCQSLSSVNVTRSLFMPLVVFYVTCCSCIMPHAVLVICLRELVVHWVSLLFFLCSFLSCCLAVGSCGSRN